MTDQRTKARLAVSEFQSAGRTKFEAERDFTRDPYINGGDLCITGTRIPVWVLWDARSGSSFQEYIDNLQMDYPSLSTDQIKSALRYAFGHPVEIDKDRLRHEVMSDDFGESAYQRAER